MLVEAEADGVDDAGTVDAANIVLLASNQEQRHKVTRSMSTWRRVVHCSAKELFAGMMQLPIHYAGPSSFGRLRPASCGGAR